MKALNLASDIESAVQLEANRWIERLDSEADNEKSWSEFHAWLTASPQHAQAYHRAELARCDADLYREAIEQAGLGEKGLVNHLGPARASVFRSRIALWTATVAASVLVALAIRVHTERLPWQYYSSLPGQTSAITLRDGSVVTLDSNTTVRADLTIFHRRLELVRGRALFVPRHVWLRPFDVTVNQHVVEATGTQFVINRISDTESETLVTQGSVKVMSSARELLTTVKAGQLASINPNGGRVETVSRAEIERRMAWQEEVLDFAETLAQAVDEFNQHNRRKLVIDDPSISSLPVVGRYDAHNPDLFAEDLESIHHIEHIAVGAPGSNSGEIHLGRANTVPLMKRDRERE